MRRSSRTPSRDDAAQKPLACRPASRPEHDLGLGLGQVATEKTRDVLRIPANLRDRSRDTPAHLRIDVRRRTCRAQIGIGVATRHVDRIAKMIEERFGKLLMTAVRESRSST